MRKAIFNIAIEFGPIIGFLIAGELLSFINATIVFVALTALSLIVAYIDRKKVALFPLIAGISIILGGVLTITLKDPFYLIIKDTAYNGLFALILFYGLAKDKAFLKPLFDGLFLMTDKGWRILTFRWAVTFTLLTISNEIVRVLVSPEEWIMYKGLATLATIIFALYQFKLSRKERLPEASTWGMRA
jgi:intracellular septation protein